MGVLDEKLEAVYKRLSMLFIINRGHSGVISCTNPHFQKIDRMVFDVD